MNYDLGAIDFSWNVCYLGRMSRSTFENGNQHIGRCPSTGSGAGIVGFSGGTCTPGELTLLDPLDNDQFEDPFFKRQTYHNVRLNWDLKDTDFNFYVGVDNVFDNKPPFGQLGTAAGDPYDTFGAFYYVGFRYEM